MRKVSFFFLFFLSIISFSFSSFAGVASGSNAMRVPRASWSNASKAWDDFKDSFDQINDVNSVSSDDVAVRASTKSLDVGATLFSVSTGDWVADVKPYKVALSSSGNYYDYYFEKAPSGTYYHELLVTLYRSQLPSSGTYGFTGYFVEGDIDFSPTFSTIRIDSKSSNVQGVSNYCRADLYNDSASVHRICSNITIPSNVNSLVYMMAWPEHMTDKFDIMTPVNNPYTFTFKKIDGASSAGPAADSTPSSDTVIADNSSTIAENSNRQVEQGDSIIELIKNTIQTISSQLESFWNQLAGEFTNLYNKMNQHHSEDLAKVDEQISADRQNTDDLINNQDKNTDQITGGYDSSGLDSSGNKLNDSLTGLEDNENAIHDQASGWITDFTLPNFDQLLESGGILAACLWLGQFWQSMFTNMGAFNIPVTLSLCLIFVLMLVGYHRFKR